LFEINTTVLTSVLGPFVLLLLLLLLLGGALGVVVLVGGGAWGAGGGVLVPVLLLTVPGALFPFLGLGVPVTVFETVGATVFVLLGIVAVEPVPLTTLPAIVVRFRAKSEVILATCRPKVPFKAASVVLTRCLITSCC
jgi:hypothetical protein